MWMNPIICTPTKQTFNGVAYYRSRGKVYFQRVVNRSKSEALHRVVWEFHNGAIPEKHHVHHINGDAADNRIENLRLMDAGSHLSMHMTPERREWARQHIRRQAEKAAAWHRSPEGRAWHKAHARSRGPITEETRRRLSVSQSRAANTPKMIEMRRNLAASRPRSSKGHFLPLTTE